MSYAADHLAWQQRVNQEFSAASRFMDRTYTNQMGMTNPTGVGSQFSYGPKQTAGYIAKSRLKSTSSASVRSKSMRSGMSRRSHLSRKKPTKRFNEEIDAQSRASKPRAHNYQFTKQQPAASKPAPTKLITEEKKQLIDKINKMDETNLEKLVQKPTDTRSEMSVADSIQQQAEGENNGEYVDDDEEGKNREDQDLHDEIDSLYYGSQYSHTESRRTNMTSATYISKLEKELQEERRARENLAKELEEIKKLSSEISSHLGLNKDAPNK
jgi:hypothetical protein